MTKTIILLLMAGAFLCSCSQSGTTGTRLFQPDTLSLIRNPGMGWTLYDDANDAVADADAFWEAQDSIARKYASVLYIRWRWSDMEPEEGRYAWEYNDNFKKLVKGAIDRGLRLALRVYVASQDNLYDATPAFVFDAGAEYFWEDGLNGKVRSPYPDDDVFQRKFSNFVRAFAAEFDNPDMVNYVDAYNLGWWGEGDHLTFRDWTNSEKTFAWITDLYGNAFKKVPLVIAVDSQIGHDIELKYAIDGQGYAIRRDGYASYWMPERQHELIRGLFPKCFVVSECCYWQDRTIEAVNSIDKKYKWNSWGEYYRQAMAEALGTHANYFDLREPVEALRWVTQAKPEVLQFIRKGGYRIYPTSVSWKMSADGLHICHKWKNLGVGVFPNNNRRWNYKYGVVFGLFNQNDELVRFVKSENAEPSAWINEKEEAYGDYFSLSGIQKGRYALATAIADTENGSPGSFINLAVDKEYAKKINEWLFVNEIEIN